MANEKKGGTGIRYDDFVKNVRPDPGSSEQLVLLHGYVGASTSDDKIRLYSDASLNEYADIAKADIVYSLPNEDDPLGGSRFWVKQSATVNYADAAQTYAQGDMYNNYMNDMYTPGTQTMGAGAATLTCTIGQLTNTTVCRPTRFICPTPVSRLIICTLPPRTRLGCPPPITQATCPQPSWVDACPSQWGCTIQTGTTVINPGTGGAQFAGDYTGGDVYNDYMQNSYQPGTENFGPGAATSPQVCYQAVTIGACQTSPVICRITQPVFCRTNVIMCRFTKGSPWCPPVTCALGTIRPTTIPSIACYTVGCATDFTRVQTTLQTAGATVAATVGAQFAGDYTGGDVYNDYMQNAYSPGMENFGPSPATQVCPQPISAPQNCISLQVVCLSRQVVCISRPAWRCIITRNNLPSICRPCWVTTQTTTGPSAVDGCPSTPGGCMTDITRTIRTDTINPGGGFYDYGY
ncbi:MAG: hypothetical protein U0U70_08280 [Chitinophagaceae bacterium]